MWKAFKYAVVAGAMFALSPAAMAATPADTLVIAKQIDDLISLDPAEAYELSGIEMLANSYDRIMRFEPTDVNEPRSRRRRKRRGQRRRPDLHLQDPRRPDLRLGQPGHRRRRSLVAAARDQAREDPGVPAQPARLDQGQRRRHGDRARRLDPRGPDRRRFRPVAGLRASRLGRRLGRRQQGRDGARSRWRHGQRLAEDQLGRFGRLHHQVVDAQ